jgi:hypothetical protein
MAKKVDNYVTFVASDKVKKNAGRSFGGYTDELGEKHYIAMGRDRQTGEDIEYRFKFSRDKRFITVPINKKDINGKSWVEFLRNHPLNSDVRGGERMGWFKEMNSERDASVALESVKLRNKAENLALNLKPSEFDEVCKVLGFDGTEQVKLHKILQYATRNASDFIELVDDPNRKATSIFRSALANKIITKHGFRFVYRDTHVGNDEAKAIAKIAEDKDLQEVLSEALKKAGA